MASRLTKAMEQAYTAVKVQARIYETVEMNHVTFDEPIRLVTGVEDDMSFPLKFGVAPVLFRACPIQLVLPGSSEDGPSSAQMTVNNVASELNPYLNAAVKSDTPILCVYRSYTEEDLTQPGDVISGLELWEVDLDVGTATGTLKFRELELQAYPLTTYDEKYYPALQENANGR